VSVTPLLKLKTSMVLTISFSLGEVPDGSAHGLIGHSDEAHGDFLHGHFRNPVGLHEVVHLEKFLFINALAYFVLRSCDVL
jgi:hypothetical protein